MKIETQTILNNAQNILKAHESLKNRLTSKRENSNISRQNFLNQVTQYKQRLFNAQSRLTENQMFQEGLSQILISTRDNSLTLSFENLWRNVSEIAKKWDQEDNQQIRDFAKTQLDQISKYDSVSIEKFQSELSAKIDEIEKINDKLKDDILKIQISSENWNATGLIRDKSIAATINELSNGKAILNNVLTPPAGDKIQDLLD